MGVPSGGGMVVVAVWYVPYVVGRLEDKSNDFDWSTPFSRNFFAHPESRFRDPLGYVVPIAKKISFSWKFHQDKDR
jgi:hypothetical protein